MLQIQSRNGILSIELPWKEEHSAEFGCTGPVVHFQNNNANCGGGVFFHEDDPFMECELLKKAANSLATDDYILVSHNDTGQARMRAVGVKLFPKEFTPSVLGFESPPSRLHVVS